MKNLTLPGVLLLAGVCALRAAPGGMTFIPADNPSIRYFGRWDMTDPLRPRYSWPGVCIEAGFRGTRIGVRMLDTTDYFNVYIDGALHGVFHCTAKGAPDYVVADSLADAPHTFRFSRRNITFEEPYTFCGLLLGEGGEILAPPPAPGRKIEFIGDSFVAAESDEAKVQTLGWEERYPVTNIDAGFAPRIARHFNAQYVTTCRSGAGMYCDWRGSVSGTIPVLFDRTLMESPVPKWDFTKWVPDVAVVALGLNDFSGLRDSTGSVSEIKSGLFRAAYRRFLVRLRAVYPGVKIVAVAAYVPWVRDNVSKIVEEEQSSGRHDIFYARYDRLEGGYVGNGHPTVATHGRMAEQLIAQIEALHVFDNNSE